MKVRANDREMNVTLNGKGFYVERFKEGRI